MTRYTYKVVPAPSKGRKAPGVKGAEARFSHGLEDAINKLAVEGWEYLRADILPSEERQGLTSTHTVYRTVLIFRREAEAPVPEPRTFPPLTAERASSDMDDADMPEAGSVPEEPLAAKKDEVAESRQEEIVHTADVAYEEPSGADIIEEDGAVVPEDSEPPADDVVEAETEDRRD